MLKHEGFMIPARTTLIVFGLSLLWPKSADAMITSHSARVHARILSYSQRPLSDSLDPCAKEYGQTYQAEIVLTWIAEGEKEAVYGKGGDGSFSNSDIPRAFFSGMPLKVGFSLATRDLEESSLKPGTYVVGTLRHTIAETHRYPCAATSSWGLEIEKALDSVAGFKEETPEGRLRTVASLLDTSANTREVMNALEQIGAPAGYVWQQVCAGKTGGYRSWDMLDSAVQMLDRHHVVGSESVLIALLTRDASEFPRESNLGHREVAARLTKSLLSALKRMGDSNSLDILKRYVDEPQGVWLYTDESLRREIEGYLNQQQSHGKGE